MTPYDTKHATNDEPYYLGHPFFVYFFSLTDDVHYSSWLVLCSFVTGYLRMT